MDERYSLSVLAIHSDPLRALFTVDTVSLVILSQSAGADMVAVLATLAVLPRPCPR